MSKKKIFILISIVVFLLVLALYFFLQKSPAQPAPTQQNTTGQSNPIPTVGTPVKMLPDEHSLTVTDTTDNAIQKSFDDFSAAKPTAALEWSKVSDLKNRSVPLYKFLHAAGASLDPQLNSLLDDNNYDLFTCNDAGKLSYGINLNLRLLPNYQGNLYQDEVKFMKNWEKSLFHDTAKILFPGVAFTDAQLRQPTIFKDGVYRSAGITLPDQTPSAVNYALVDDYVILSSSNDCLKRALAEVYSTTD
jgi:hypothetical protein